MELENSKICMDEIKCRAISQIALEDDKNLQDDKLDVGKILRQKGFVKLDECRPVNDHVVLKGRLLYCILYQSENDNLLDAVEGELPFEEQVIMEGIASDDQITVEMDLEDLTIGLINSRKLSIQAVLNLNIYAENMCEIPMPLDIKERSGVETLKKSLEVADLVVMKRDVFRWKEELELPQNYPNIGMLVWKEITVPELEFRAVEEKLFVKGEVKAFFLYRGERDGQLQVFVATIPINGSLDCMGCKEHMVTDVTWRISNEDISVGVDFDDEQRMFLLEMSLDLYLKLYEEKKIDILADCYGTRDELFLERKETLYKSALIHSTGRCKLNETLDRKELGSDAKLVYATARVQKESMQKQEKGMDLLGSVEADFLMETGDKNYEPLHVSMPYHYLMETPEIEPENICHLDMNLDHLGLTLNGDQWECRGTLNVDLAAFQMEREYRICDIAEDDSGSDGTKKMPGMVGYVVKKNDTLWDIGKKFMVSLDSLKENNELVKDELHQGDKILIVKSF